MSRLRSAVRGPGIDPRVWITDATVKELGFDSDEGIFADVQLQPTGEEETVYVGQPCSGDGFGDWCPLEVGDTVLVAIPHGDHDFGGWVISRAHNAADKPPADFRSEEDSEAPTLDRVVVLKPGSHFRLRTSNGGVIKMQAATQSFVRGEDLQSELDKLKQALQSFGTDLAASTPAAPNAALTVADVITAVATLSQALGNINFATPLSSKIKGE